MATAYAWIVFRAALRGGRQPGQTGGVEPEPPSMFSELRRCGLDERVLDPEAEDGTSGADERFDVPTARLRASRHRYAAGAVAEGLKEGIVGAQRVQSLA